MTAGSKVIRSNCISLNSFRVAGGSSIKFLDIPLCVSDNHGATTLSTGLAKGLFRTLVIQGLITDYNQPGDKDAKCKNEQVFHL